MNENELIKTLKEISTTITLREIEKYQNSLRISYKDLGKTAFKTSQIKGYSVNMDTNTTSINFRREYITSKFIEFIGIPLKEFTNVMETVRKENLFQELNILVNSTIKAKKELLLQ